MTHITLRTHLIGSVTDFCAESALCLVTPEILVDLIVRLSRYQEEGVSLFPQVYLTADIDSLIGMLPDGEKLQLASTALTIDGIAEMLKVCAPIATGDWKVFGQTSEHAMSFGVFRGSSRPVAVAVDDVLLTGPPATPVVKVHRVADECVQVRNSKGTCRYIFFNHKREDGPPPLMHVANLIAFITKRVSGRNRDTVQSYLTKLVMEALSEGHGCTWAVTYMGTFPKILKDGIFFEDPIDFQSMIAAVLKKTDDVSDEVLIRKAELVKGMLCCDGIALFDEHARLLGYRCFVSLSRKVRVVGGARKRAFSTLKGHLRRGLSAVFMQSQDGNTEFESVPHD